MELYEILIGLLFYIILISLIILYMYMYVVFKWVMIINNALQVIERRFRKLGLIQGHTTVITCSILWLGCDIELYLRILKKGRHLSTDLDPNQLSVKIFPTNF